MKARLEMSITPPGPPGFSLAPRRSLQQPPRGGPFRFASFEDAGSANVHAFDPPAQAPASLGAGRVGDELAFRIPDGEVGVEPDVDRAFAVEPGQCGGCAAHPARELVE